MKAIKPISTVILALTLAACGSNSSQEGEGSTSDLGNNSANNSSAVVNPVDVNSGVSGSDFNTGSDSINAGSDAMVELETVFYFNYDQATLTDAARVALDLQAKALLKSDNNFRLEGHADERGTRDYNLALGERRAKTVMNYLKLRGVASSRMDVISYGEEKPAVLGTGPAVWQQNRRVEIK